MHDLDAERSGTANLISHTVEDSSAADSDRTLHAPRAHGCRPPHAQKPQRTDASGSCTDTVITAPATSSLHGKARDHTARTNARDAPSSSSSGGGGGDGAASDNRQPAAGTTAARLDRCLGHAVSNELSDGPTPITKEQKRQTSTASNDDEPKTTPESVNKTTASSINPATEQKLISVQSDALNDAAVQHITAGDGDDNRSTDSDNDCRPNVTTTPSYDDDITLKTQHADSK